MVRAKVIILIFVGVLILREVLGFVVRFLISAEVLIKIILPLPLIYIQGNYMLSHNRLHKHTEHQLFIF
jgi:hypothetical protein